MPSTRERTVELTNFRVGTMEDGSGVYVNLILERVRAGATPHMTVEHEPTVAYARFTASWNITKPTDSGGQVQPEDRVLKSIRRGLQARDIEEIDTLWKTWHLNDMQAGCAHMPGYDELARLAREAGIKDRNGDPDVLNLKKTCESSGYRWGTSWLVRPMPLEVEQQIVRLVSRLRLAV